MDAAISWMPHTQCLQSNLFSSFHVRVSFNPCLVDSIVSLKEIGGFTNLNISRNSQAYPFWRQRRNRKHAQATPGCTPVLRMHEKRCTTLYNVLGVSEDVTDHEIKESFRRIAKAYHPDHASPDQREEFQQKFMEAYNAYNVLKDPQSRAMYDFQIKKASGFRDGIGLQNWRGQWRGCNWETDQCWTS